MNWWDDLPEHWLEEGRQRPEHRSLRRQVLLKYRWDELPEWDELPVHRHRRHMRVGRVGHRFEQRESSPPGIAQRLDAGPGQDGGIDSTDRDPCNDLRCEILPGFIERLQDAAFVRAQSTAALKDNRRPHIIPAHRGPLYRSSRAAASCGR